MAIKYLYLDDDPEGTVGRIATALSIPGKLEVEYMTVRLFKPQVEFLLSKDNPYDGLLLDLRLDQRETENGDKAEFTATTLAQYLRTKVYDRESELADFPIVLCSQDKKIGMFSVDLSSHDLFDYKFLKEEVEENASTIAQRLIDLAEGYQLIFSAQKNWNDILHYDTRSLDARIFSRFTGRSQLAIHEYSRHILYELLKPTTDLITEEILAARLGIDINSSAAWNALRDVFFEEARYTGAFSQSWQRWWQPKVHQVFERLCGTTLASVDGSQRVSLLIEATQLTELASAVPIQLNHSNWYWTICQAYRTPLDPSEGFRLSSEREPLAWQDYDYISLKGLLERKHKTDLHRDLHPDEEDRFDYVKQDYA